MTRCGVRSERLTHHASENKSIKRLRRNTSPMPKSTKSDTRYAKTPTFNHGGLKGPSACILHSCYRTQQLRLQDIFPLLVLLARLVGFVVFPTDRLITLLALDVSYNMPAGGHVSFHRFRLLDIDDRGKEECLAMLAAEIARNDVVEVSEVCLTVLHRSISGQVLTQGEMDQRCLPCIQRFWQNSGTRCMQDPSCHATLLLVKLVKAEDLNLYPPPVAADVFSGDRSGSPVSSQGSTIDYQLVLSWLSRSPRVAQTARLAEGREAPQRTNGRRRGTGCRSDSGVADSCRKCSG